MFVLLFSHKFINNIKIQRIKIMCNILNVYYFLAREFLFKGQFMVPLTCLQSTKKKAYLDLESF